MCAQRVRVRFRKGARLRFISHLDVLRSWERSIRRAGLPLAYSQGFTPHPKLAFASPLPLGFTAEREIMDITLSGPVAPAELSARLAQEAVADMPVVAVEEIAVAAPAPQAVMLWSDYRVTFGGYGAGELSKVVEDFRALAALPWVEERGERRREYDLRAATAALDVWAAGDSVGLSMRLQSDQDLTARPEAILTALVPAAEVHEISRTDILVDGRSPARDLWRRSAQYQ